MSTKDRLWERLQPCVQSCIRAIKRARGAAMSEKIDAYKALMMESIDAPKGSPEERDALKRMREMVLEMNDAEIKIIEAYLDDLSEAMEQTGSGDMKN